MSVESERIGLVVSVLIEIDEGPADALTELIAEVIREELGVDVIAGRESRRRLPPEGLPETCLAEATCRSDVGRRLDADQLIFLAIIALGDDVQVDATWTDVGSGQLMSRPRVLLSKGADRRERFREALPTWLPHMRPRPEPAPPVESNSKAPTVIVTQAPAEPESSRQMNWVSWTATGVSAAALAGGIVFAFRARSDYQGLQDDGCRDFANPDCSQSRIDDGKRDALVADILFGTSLAAGITAVVSVLMSDPIATEPAVRMTGGAGSVGVSWGGRF